jgi:two-component sensor histidine kinase
LCVPLDPDLHAPRIGRRAAERYFTRISDAACSAMVIVVSELVTNAVLYGGPPIKLRLQLGKRGAYVEVEDGDARMAPLKADSRGLRIVEAVALRWGISHGANRKSVWAYLPVGREEHANPETVAEEDASEV